MTSSGKFNLCKVISMRFQIVTNILTCYYLIAVTVLQWKYLVRTFNTIYYGPFWCTSPGNILGYSGLPHVNEDKILPQTNLSCEWPSTLGWERRLLFLGG